MINEDWEHDAQREIIYLQEDLELDKEELLQERKPAKIVVIKTPQNEHKEMADIRGIDEDGIQPGSDVPSTSDESAS